MKFAVYDIIGKEWRQKNVSQITIQNKLKSFLQHPKIRKLMGSAAKFATALGVPGAVPVAAGCNFLEALASDDNKVSLEDFVNSHALTYYLQSFEEQKLSLNLPEELPQDCQLPPYKVNQELAQEIL